eukprot:m.6397 g.6397  ORF g.6397 m.6397 type:complete len:193 (+) comp3528_c0_seq1:86-664(+)
MNTFAWKMRVVACTVVLCWATISEEAAALDTEIQNTSQILKIHNFSMILHRAGKKTTYRTTYPKFLVGPVLDAKSKISIKFMVSYGDEARSFRQVFVRIYNSSTHREIFYLPEYAEDNHTYHLKLDLSKELESFDYVSGNYTMVGILGNMIYRHNSTFLLGNDNCRSRHTLGRIKILEIFLISNRVFNKRVS